MRAQCGTYASHFVYILNISNQLDEFEIFVTAYIIEDSLIAYQIGYVVNRCPRRQFQTLISQIMQ